MDIVGGLWVVDFGVVDPRGEAHGYWAAGLLWILWIVIYLNLKKQI